jgi:hypothetical protein
MECEESDREVQAKIYWNNLYVVANSKKDFAWAGQECCGSSLLCHNSNENLD